MCYIYGSRLSGINECYNDCENQKYDKAHQIIVGQKDIKNYRHFFFLHW